MMVAGVVSGIQENAGEFGWDGWGGMFFVDFCLVEWLGWDGVGEGGDRPLAVGRPLGGDGCGGW